MKNKISNIIRVWHLLFQCQTFWRVKPAFTCPICGKTYRCFLDGNDVEEFRGVCNDCLWHYNKNGKFPGDNLQHLLRAATKKKEGSCDSHRYPNNP